ncbi:MAG TPA: patatin-like phospholipase family protein, partial [Labilithrix sp.]
RRFDRFVGASAGALNATLLAASVAAHGDIARGAEVLERLWIEKASFGNFFRFGWSPLTGLSRASRVVDLVESALAELTSGASAVATDVKLTIVTTDLHGSSRGSARTHEDARVFDGLSLLDPAKRRDVAEAAAASAAFPFLFVPPILHDGKNVHQHVDGGVVNNAPMAYVLGDRDAIVVVTAEAPSPSSERDLRGGALVSRLVDVLVNERIARDLVVARKRNRTLDALEKAMAGAKLDDAQKKAVRDAIGWKHLHIEHIHPHEDLPGGSFKGFFSKKTRIDHVARGRRAVKIARETAAHTNGSLLSSTP